VGNPGIEKPNWARAVGALVSTTPSKKLAIKGR